MYTFSVAVLALQVLASFFYFLTVSISISQIFGCWFH